jgi:hypothetical protein
MSEDRGAAVTTAISEFVDVFIEPCPCAQDGLVLRFMQAGPAAKEIDAVFYSDELGREGWWRVRGAMDPDARERGVARAVLVQDSSAGTSLLIEGGTHGLALELEADPSVRDRVAYLLLAETTRVR